MFRERIILVYNNSKNLEIPEIHQYSQKFGPADLQNIFKQDSQLHKTEDGSRCDQSGVDTAATQL